MKILLNSQEKFGLRDCSITIEKGILGLLGPNGAFCCSSDCEWRQKALT